MTSPQRLNDLNEGISNARDITQSVSSGLETHSELFANGSFLNRNRGQILGLAYRANRPLGQFSTSRTSWNIRDTIEKTANQIKYLFD